MNDINKSITAKDWILKLANGINPLDGTAIKDDDIVNNVHISRCFFYVADLIDTTLQKNERKSKEYDLSFNLSVEDLSKIRITEKTGISNFTREINAVIPKNMKPLPYSKIINWLMNNGYLIEIIKEDGGKAKQATEAGNSIGIYSEVKNGTNGPYIAVEYNANAQHFILNNINAIVEA